MLKSTKVYLLASQSPRAKKKIHNCFNEYLKCTGARGIINPAAGTTRKTPLQAPPGPPREQKPARARNRDNRLYTGAARDDRPIAIVLMSDAR